MLILCPKLFYFFEGQLYGGHLFDVPHNLTIDFYSVD